MFKNRMIVVLTALTAGLLCATCWGRGVAPEDAGLAVRNWMKRGLRPMDSRFKSGRPVRTRSLTNDVGRTLFHVVDMEGGGFVVTSGDTQLPPVIAFSGTGALDLSDARNPLNALLKSDLEQRSAAISRASMAKASWHAANALSAGEASFEAQWAALLDYGGSKAAYVSAGHRGEYSSYQSVSDVRVAPLVQSKWDQGQWNGYNTFNYYTPNNYVSGCPATAFAQIMRYWCVPSWYVVAAECSCAIDSVAYACTMMGGYYDWSNMPLMASECTSETQRKAIGKLLYDVGAASQSNWGRDASGTFACIVAQALRKNFGYASAHSFMSAPDVEGNSGYLTDNISTSADFRNAILASLDAGMPAAISISESTSGGHVVVVDGYGYNGGSLIYCHINCGWSGSQDLWYNLIGEGVTSSGFKTVWEVAYNIHPYVAGDVISGRVTDSQGYPVEKATVTLTSANGSDTAETNEKGIYFFRAAPSIQYTITVSFAGQTLAPRVVTLPAGGDTDFTVTGRTDGGGTAYDWPPGMEHPFGKLGNLWGVDFTLGPIPDLYAPEEWSGWSSPLVVSTSAGTTYSTSTAFSPDDELYLSWLCGCRGGDAAQDFYTALYVDDEYVYQWYSAGGLASGYGVCVTGHSLGRLPKGTHTIKIVYDHTGSVAESNEGNNTVTLTITIDDAFPDLCFFSPEGWDKWPSPVFLSDVKNATSAKTSFAEGDPIYLYCRFGNGGTATTASGHRVLHEVLDSAGSVISTTFYDCSAGSAPGDAGQWGGETFAIPQNLSAGRYVYRCTLDSNNAITEIDEVNNVVTIDFTVVSSYCTVTFNPVNGNVSPATLSVLKGSAVGALPTPTRGGFTFAGWFTAANGGTQIAASTKVTANVTYYAHWTPRQYKLTFNANGGTSSPAYAMVDYCKTCDTFPTPTWSGHTFNGWFTARTGGTKVTAPWKCTGNKTIYAQWTVKQYKLTFNANGGTSSPEYAMVDYCKTCDTFPTPTWGGHTFNGWFTARTGGTQVTAPWKCTGNKTIYAQWTVKQYKLTFDGNGGTVSPSYAMVDYCKTYDTFPTPTWGGHTFNGWFTARSGGTKVTAPWKCTGNKTTYAQWTVKQYTITYNANGGTVSPASQKVNYCATYTLPTPTWGGHTFDGWYTAKTGGTKVTSPAKCTGNATLYARWK